MTQTAPEIISGRRDFDVVSFKDYESDMRENGDRVLALHQHYQREIQTLKNALWQIVLASGGRVLVTGNYTFYREQDLDWQISQDMPTDGLLMK